MTQNCSNCYKIENHCMLPIPGTQTYLTPGCKVRLSKFETTIWVVNVGWYSWGNNRETCGWYLCEFYNPDVIKPLNRNDLDDIYYIEQ